MCTVIVITLVSTEIYTTQQSIPIYWDPPYILDLYQHGE